LEQTIGMGRSKLFLVLGILVILNARGISQQPALQYSEGLLNLTVVAKNGDIIGGLKSENFSIVDGKEVHAISFVAPQDEPSTIGILIDKSGSVDTKNFFPAVARAISVFLKSDARTNEYFLMSFNTSQDLVLDFTRDKNRVHDSLQSLAKTEPKGNTAFYSALNSGFEKIVFSSNRKRALVVVTDALDNSSDITYSRLKERMKKSCVPVYFVSTLAKDSFSSMLGSAAISYMQDIMSTCGGSAVYLKQNDDLDRAMLQLGREIQNQYLIGFRLNTDQSETGKVGWRPIEVKVTLPKDSKIAGKPYVRVPRGYYFEKKDA